MTRDLLRIAGLVLAVLLLLHARSRRHAARAREDRSTRAYEPVEPPRRSWMSDVADVVSRAHNVYSAILGVFVLGVVTYLFFTDSLVRWIVAGTVAVMIATSAIFLWLKARNGPMTPSHDAAMIRPALPSDAPALTEIARAAKASWGYPEDWLREWDAQLTFTPEYLESHTVFVATARQVPVGVIALVATPEPEIDHLWVAPDAQGLGVGRELVEHAVEAARSRGWTSLRILSDPGAVPFYERMGAVAAGEVAAPVCGTERFLPVLRLEL